MSDNRIPDDQTTWVWSVVAAIVLCGAVVAVFRQAITSPFFFDDRHSVEQNVSITRLWPLSGPLSVPRELPTAGRPLVNLSLALNYRWGHLDPRGYHAVNMIFHTLSALLLFGIVRRTLRLPFFNPRFDSAAEPLALAVAILWAVHPLQTESVAYITQRTELMVGFFYLATLYASLRYWLSESTGSRRLWLCLAVLASLGGMASKEVMVSAPLVMLLFDRVFVSGSFRKALATSWPLYVGLAATWGLLLALNIQGPRSDTTGFSHDVSPTAWWLTQSKIFLTYLKLTFWPWPLTIHYEVPYLTLQVAWPYLLVTSAIAIASLVLFWRGYSAGFIGAWIFAILSPTLVIPIITEVAAERRMYLPLAGIVALVVITVYRLAQFASGIRASALLIVATVTPFLLLSVALSIVSYQRLAVYESPIALWRDVLERQPNDAMALYSLGTLLTEAGRRDEAIPVLQQAVTVGPRANSSQINNLACALVTLGRSEEATEQFRKALELDPDYAAVHWNLGAALCRTGHGADGVAHLNRSLELNPNDGAAHYEVGNILMEINLGGEALAHFKRAVELNPDLPKAQLSLAICLQSEGHINEAVPHFLRAAETNPNDAELRRLLANALVATGRAEDAIVQLREAAQLAPNDLEAWISLAECHHGLRHPTDAVAAAERALELAKAGEDRDVIDRCEQLLAECRAGIVPRDEDARESH